MPALCLPGWICRVVRRPVGWWQVGISRSKGGARCDRQAVSSKEGEQNPSEEGP